MNSKIKSLLGAALLLCGSLITPTAKANPPCFLFTVTGSPSMAVVYLNGHSIKGATAQFYEGDDLAGSYNGCPPDTAVVATLTTYRWDIQALRYYVVGTSNVTLGSACESGDWTLHTNFQSQNQPCLSASATYTVNQLYCPCGQ